MKILVVGAKGQLGNEIMKLASPIMHEWVFVDVNSEGGDVLKVDVTDRDQVSAIVTPDVDVIINCSAYNEVDKAEGDMEAAMKVNAYAVGLLAEAALKADALLIHFSTDYVFDGKANVPYTEDCEPAPVNAYGRSKLAGERMVIGSGCRHMIFRTSWLYSLTGRNFFRTMAVKTAEMSSLKVVFDQTGTPTYAGDLAFLIKHIIDNGMLDRTGIYHYSNEGSATWYDFAREINDLLGYTCDVEPCRTGEYPSVALRPSYSVMDKKKVKDTFGLPVPHWRESLRLLVREYERCEA